MKFGDLPLAEAEGAILAHSLALPAAGGEARGPVFKKGRRLSADDVRALAVAGYASVMAARLGPDDIHEDEAATTLAAASAGAHLDQGKAFTGRANLFAAARGIAVVDRARLDQVNLLDEAITVATLPPYAVVDAKQMVATVKIIPFAVPAAVVEACVGAATAGGGALGVAAFRPLRLGLVISYPAQASGPPPGPTEDIAPVTRARIEALGGTLDQPVCCPHRPDALEDAIRRALAAGCDVLAVSAAAVTTDRRDMVPQAVARMGGRIEYFGMPVEPGNLLLLARIGRVPVLVLPGCARRADLNGLDLILRRLAAGLPVRAADIMEMGVGGLLD